MSDNDTADQSATNHSGNTLIGQIESGKTTRSHYRVLALSGAGVFMDGYDLFIISVALLLIKPAFATTALEFSAISSSAIMGAVFGAVIFGNLADRLGRKFLYVVDLVFFVVFGAASAFSQNVWELVLFRILLGIGIGADYPISASYIAEFVSNKSRGKLIAAVFAFQGLGILAAVTVSVALLPLGGSSWRWMLLSGVFPALIALTLRTKMPETPRWYLSHGHSAKAQEVMSKFFGYNVTTDQLSVVTEKVSVKELLLSPYSRRVFFTSASWFLVDVGVYGIGILLPTLIHSIYGSTTPLIASAVTTGILYVFAGFGYLSSIGLIDTFGRKRLQMFGFLGMAISLSIAAFMLRYSTLSLLSLFVLFAVFYIFENAGPNPTTWIYPVELFPTRLRGTGHGIAATIGKVGALFATFLLPLVLYAVGQAAMLAIVAAACFAGAALTFVMGIETKQLSLEDVSEIFSSFYDTFDKISSNVLSAAEAFNSNLKKVFTNNEKFNPVALASAIKLLEHNGDDLVHDAFTKLAKKFIAPIDRQDISSLLKALDDMLDFIDATASRMQVFHVEHVTKEMVQFSDIILEQARAIREAILALKAAKAQVIINQSAIRVDQLENEADELLRDTLGAIFEVFDESKVSLFNIMKIKEIFEHLETTTDRAEDVADVLRNLIIKYSL